MDSGDEGDVDEKAVAEDDKTEADQNDQRIGNADELTGSSFVYTTPSVLFRFAFFYHQVFNVFCCRL